MNLVDPLGLVKWSGSASAIGLIDGGGAMRFTFDLTSECVNGKQAKASVNAGGFAVGFGLTLTGTTSSVDFEDNLAVPDPYVFQGQVLFVGIGYALGPDNSKMPISGKVGGGLSLSAITLGEARSIPQSIGIQYGLDFSVYGGAGISTVVNGTIENCECINK